VRCRERPLVADSGRSDAQRRLSGFIALQPDARCCRTMHPTLTQLMGASGELIALARGDIRATIAISHALLGGRRT
jgi:hypothetical protein